MPTPINHLVMAQEVVESGLLSSPVQELLTGAYGSFLLGHTAPDVQTVSGQRRVETHFYTLPPTSDTPPYRAMLETYPDLGRPERLEPAHAAFLCGYIAHLLADEIWLREIFVSFGRKATWGSWRERLFLHNVLRTYLDRQDQARLNGSAGGMLAGVVPHGWLPFVRDEDLVAWRDLLVHQLQPGERVRTAEVFAARMHLPPEMIESVLGSPQQMERIFRRVSPERLASYRRDVLVQSAALINNYLGG